MSRKTKAATINDDGKPALVPKLRFPGFEESWSNDPLSKTLVEHKLKNIDGRDVFSVSMGSGIVNQIEHLGRSFAASNTAHYNLGRHFDIVFTKSPLKAFPFGIVKQCKFDGEVAVSPLYGVFTPANPHVGLMIEAYFESSSRSKAFLSPLCQKGAKNTIQITNTTFLSGRLPLPTQQDEQQQIAECLISVDELIAAQARKVDALKTHKKALMQQLFPREGETRPRLRFPEFQNAGEWETKRTDDQGDVLAGKALAVNAPGPLRPYLRTKNVLDGAIDLSDVLMMPMTDAEFSRFEILDGDVLLNEGQSLELVGRTSIYRGEFGRRCAMQNQLLRFRANPSTCPEFAAQAFRQCQKDGTFASVATQTTSIAHLGSSRFSALALTWPPSLAEQQRIADCLSSLDALITAETQKLEALKTHKKGLMQQLFPEANASQYLSVRPAIAFQVAAFSKNTEPVEASLPKPYKAGFARQLLAAEILQHCHQHPTMGRVKLQKLIHLCEYLAELDDIHGNYVRAAAGPFDNKLMRGVATGLEKQKWFKQVRGEKRVTYEPMVSSGQHSKYLEQWSKQLPKIREIINCFATAKTLSCEIASTLYAAWNDLLIEGRQPTDVEIIREASDPERWHESKANIDEIKWPTALKWMRKKGFAPRGYGAHTTRSIAKGERKAHDR